MLKKTITFDDYSEPPKEVTETFYFNFTKIEIMEKLQLEDLEGKIQRLTETENAKEAYNIFKESYSGCLRQKSP